MYAFILIFYKTLKKYKEFNFIFQKKYKLEASKSMQFRNKSIKREKF